MEVASAEVIFLIKKEVERKRGQKQTEGIKDSEKLLVDSSLIYTCNTDGWREKDSNQNHSLNLHCNAKVKRMPLCTGISSRTGSSAADRWTTILILKSRKSNHHPNSLRKMLMKPSRSALLQSLMTHVTQLTSHTCINSNVYSLTSWLLLTKPTVHLNTHSWTNCTVYQN